MDTHETSTDPVIHNIIFTIHFATGGTIIHQRNNREIKTSRQSTIHAHRTGISVMFPQLHSLGSSSLEVDSEASWTVRLCMKFKLSRFVRCPSTSILSTFAFREYMAKVINRMFARKISGTKRGHRTCVSPAVSREVLLIISGCRTRVLYTGICD